MEKWLKLPSVSDTGQTDSGSGRKENKIESKKRLCIFWPGWGSGVLRISKIVQEVQYAKKIKKHGPKSSWHILPVVKRPTLVVITKKI